MADQETYYMLVTSVGRAKEAAAKAEGLTISLTHMALGDGNDETYDPIETQPALRRERYRRAIDSLTQDATNPHWFVAEAVIPSNVGGWWIREVGIYDADGDLYAIGKYPATYKPILSAGAASQLVVRTIFVVSNTESVTLMIDDSVLFATKQFVADNYIPWTGGALQGPLGVPRAAGTPAFVASAIFNGRLSQARDQGNVAYLSGTRYCSRASGALSPEMSAALASQLGIDDCQAYEAYNCLPDPDNPTDFRRTRTNGYVHLTVFAVNGKIYTLTGGSEGLQNDVIPVTDWKVDGVYNPSGADSRTKIGSMVFFPGTTAPGGWLRCNGAAVSRSSYAALFAVIGESYGAGDGSTTFSLPTAAQLNWTAPTAPAASLCIKYL